MTFAYIIEALYNLAPSGNVIRLGFVAQITNISLQNLYRGNSDCVLLGF